MKYPRPIYLDHAATTPVDPAVVSTMQRAMLDDYGNPSSRHALGLDAERRLRTARADLARRLEVDPSLLTFTSGGTEALALALVGTGQLHRRRPGHVLISALEHDAVQRSASRMLEAMGHAIETVPATADGWIAPQSVADRLRPETFLVAVMHVNNEIGTRQPVEEIARVLTGHARCSLLVDAVQSFAKLPTSLPLLGADMLCLSAHKLHGPKGVGCLARARSDVKLAPLWAGGDQEAGLRAGTENVPGIVGLAAAAALFGTDDDRLELHGRWRRYAARLEQAIRSARRGAYAIGDPARREPHILAMALPAVRSEVAVNALGAAGVFVSSGSACHSRKTLRSRVLEALGVPRDHGVIRLSVGRLTRDEEIEQAAAILETTLVGL